MVYSASKYVHAIHFMWRELSPYHCSDSQPATMLPTLDHCHLVLIECQLINFLILGRKLLSLLSLLLIKMASTLSLPAVVLCNANYGKQVSDAHQFTRRLLPAKI